MTAITFPTDPANGELYTAPNGCVYIWDGEKWIVNSTVYTGPALENISQDRVAPMFVNGVNTGITFAYNETTNTLTSTVTGGGGSGDSIDNGIYSVSVGADGVVTMSTSRGTVEFGALPEPGGTTHFHIMKGAGQDGMDLYFGDDFNYVLQRADASNGDPAYGVEIGANDLDGGSQQVWRFGTDGSLALPQGSTISETYENSRHSILLTPYVDPEYNPDMAVKIYPTFSDDDHIHITAGNPGTVDLFLGDDNQYVKIEQNAGNIVIGTNNDTHNWTFDVNGRLTLPKNSSVREVTPATGDAAHVIVIQSASSILNTSFATLPPAPISNYAVPGTGIVVNVTWSTNGEDYHAPAFVVVNGGSGHTGGGESGGGDVLTVPYADMGISGGGNWTWYVVDIASDVVLTAGLESWRFAGDGTTILPGALVKSTVAKTGGGGGTETAIDLTKSVNKLTNGSYTLADGVEGQIMYLVRQTGSTTHNVIVASARDNGTTYTNTPFLPFTDGTDPTNMATLIFTDSAWQNMGGVWSFT